MAITWGPVEGHERVGIDIVVTAESSTSISYEVRWYVGSVNYGFNDAQTLHIGGSTTATSINFQFSTPTGSTTTRHVVTRSFSATKVYGGGPTYTFTGSITGHFQGATPSHSRSFTIPARPASVPNPPGAPSFSSITSSSFHVSWTAPSNNGSALSGYQLQVATNSSFTQNSSTVTSNTWGSSRTVTGAKRKTTYWVRIRARNGVGYGPWSPVRTVTTKAEVPTMGTSYTATNVTRNSFTVSGSSVSDNGGEAPSNLRVQYNTSQSTSGAQVYTRGSWAAPTITGLTADTQYYFRVAAYNSAGWSAYGPWKSVRTLDDAPDDMAPPSFSAVDNTSMTVSWTAPNMNGATFTDYRYEVSLLDTFSLLVRSGTTTDTFVELTDLTPGTRYYVRVRANATPNNGGWGVASQKTTGFAPNSGLRTYMVIGGVVRQGELYQIINGNAKRVRPMAVVGGVVQTE